MSAAISGTNLLACVIPRISLRSSGLQAAHGKSTLTAHLAACAHAAGRRCLIIDADPQGSLTLWHSLRADGRLPLQTASRGIDRALAFAMIEGYEWVFIDTAPTMWVVVQEAIRAATLVVIPA